MLRLTRLLSSRVLTQQPARNLVSFSKQPTKVFTRSVHAAPREYNSLQSAAHHFKQQRHMPYFLEYLMWVVFGSEALHLIWLKMDYKEYRERTAHKTKLLEELIERIENGEAINDSLRQEIKMVLLNNKLQHKDSNESEDIDDDYLNHLIASSEQPIQTATQTKQSEPISDSNWMNVKQDENTGNENEKKPFFL